MTDITDIHCHIIPGVDDGARDMEQSIRMLHIMHDEGIRSVIATYHYHPGHMEADADTVRKRFDRLCELAASDDKISDMKLFPGCEVYYYPSIIEWLDEGRILTLAGSDYVLLEFSYTIDKRQMEEAVVSVRNAGYIPVIAHVERYSSLTTDHGGIDDLITRGAYIQVNAEALYSGFRTKSFVKRLLKEEKVHFIATDAHDTSSRAPLIDRAAGYVEKKYTEEYCNRIFTVNPAKIIRNEYI
ncbi:MAG: capsular biosynthesis protein [Lachnospiraceae bacterium]|nr:capsular biosynthesis protein [Lachnospiraceae bacterium]